MLLLSGWLTQSFDRKAKAANAPCLIGPGRAGCALVIASRERERKSSFGGVAVGAADIWSSQKQTIAEMTIVPSPSKLHDMDNRWGGTRASSSLHPGPGHARSFRFSR